jgi:sarcosine oxidase, subunit beta
MNGKDEAVAVIGAGSTGSSVSYHLAKIGKRVILIDMGQPASGTTSKSTALVRTHYSNEIVARMAVYSLKVLRNFEGIGYSGFVNCGMLFLGSNSLKKGMSEISSNLSRLGIRTELFDTKTASVRFPEIDFSDCDFVHFEPESGYADPVETASSYARKAKQLGAQEIFGVQAQRILLNEKHAVEAIELADGTKIHCSKTVLCTNVWTNNLLSSSIPGASLPIWAAAHPVAILRRPPKYEGVHVIVADFAQKTYYKPEGKSLFIVGSLDPALDAKKIDPERCPNEVSFEFLSFFAESASKRIPSMRDGIMHSSYIGMYDMSSDQHPIIDELSELGFTNVYSCVGLSGHGYKLCPAFGRMVAEMITESEEPMFDASYFSLSRFASGKLLQSKYATIGTIA